MMPYSNVDGDTRHVAVSADVKLPWGTRSRGGTGEKKRGETCAVWVSFSGIWSGRVTQVKLFLWTTFSSFKKLNGNFSAVGLFSIY